MSAGLATTSLTFSSQGNLPSRVEAQVLTSNSILAGKKVEQITQFLKDRHSNSVLYPSSLLWPSRFSQSDKRRMEFWRLLQSCKSRPILLSFGSESILGLISLYNFCIAFKLLSDVARYLTNHLIKRQLYAKIYGLNFILIWEFCLICQKVGCLPFYRSQDRRFLCIVLVFTTLKYFLLSPYINN